MPEHVVEVPGLTLSTNGPIFLDVDGTQQGEGTFSVQFWIRLSEVKEGPNEILSISLADEKLTITQLAQNLRFAGSSRSRDIEDVFRANASGISAAMPVHVSLTYRKGMGVWLVLHRMEASPSTANGAVTPKQIGGIWDIVPKDKKKGPFSQPPRLSFGGDTKQYTAAGIISDLRLWTNARTEDEIHADCGMQLAGNEPNLAGYWPFDPEDGRRQYDLTSNGNHMLVPEGAVIANSRVYLSMGNIDARTARLEEILGDATKRLGKLNSDISDVESNVEQSSRSLAAAQNELETLENTLRLQREKHASEIKETMEKIELERQEILSKVASSGAINWGSLVTQVERDVSTAMEARGTEGPGYSLDNIAVDLKVIPGVAGRGLHLPPPDQQIDPNRFSTLTLRLDRRPAQAKAPVKKKVPNLNGYTEALARRKLADAGFKADIVMHTLNIDEEDRIGQVVSQTPIAFAMVPLNSVVKVMIGVISGTAAGDGS